MTHAEMKNLVRELQDLMNQGEFDTVAEHVEQVLAEQPKNALLELQLGAPLIDAGEALNRVVLTHRGIELLEGCLEAFKKLSAKHEAQIRFNLSNAYSHLAIYHQSRDEIQAAQNASKKRRQNLHFAAASFLVEKNDVDPETFQRTLINYSVLLNSNGRYVEAADYCLDCLRRFPDNPMAQGTLGVALLKLARLDPHHTAHHFAVAWSMLQSAVDNPDGLMKLAGHSRIPRFEENLNWLEERIGTRKSRGTSIADWVEHTLYGQESAEPAAIVANWANARLLLTFGPATNSCIDQFGDDAFVNYLKLPVGHRTPDKAFLMLLDGLNGAKEEFVTARHIYFDALNPMANLDETTKQVSFATGFASDRAHGLHIGMRKAAFQLAHNVLDKVAYCLALYFDLKTDLKRVNFSNVWIESGAKNDSGPSLNETLGTAAQENNYLRALRDLADDWYQSRFPGPLKAHRNAATHRGLCIVDSLVDLKVDSEAAASHHQFERRTFLMLRLAKSAVLYLMGALTEQSHKDSPQLDDAYCLDFKMAYQIPLFPKS